MAMPAQPTEWTAEIVRALPDDGNRYEVIGGELFVTPAPSWTHQRAVGELFRILMPYLEEHALGDAIIAPADVLFGPKDMVEPDLFVVPLVDGNAPRTWEEVGRLLLAVEVPARAGRIPVEGPTDECSRAVAGVKRAWPDAITQ
jgi:Uma2 family endonuclease